MYNYIYLSLYMLTDVIDLYYLFSEYYASTLQGKFLIK